MQARALAGQVLFQEQQRIMKILDKLESVAEEINEAANESLALQKKAVEKHKAFLFKAEKILYNFISINLDLSFSTVKNTPHNYRGFFDSLEKPKSEYPSFTILGRFLTFRAYLVNDIMEKLNILDPTPVAQAQLEDRISLLENNRPKKTPGLF